MSPQPRIITPRLRLDLLGPADAADVFRYASDLETTRFMGWPTHRGIHDTRSWLATVESCHQARPQDDWVVAIRERVSGTVIGSTGVHGRGAGEAEMGWILHRGFQGQGLAYEGISQLVTWAWEALPELRRLWAPVLPQNGPSRALARRLGFREQGIHRSVSPQLGPELRDLVQHVLERPFQGK